MATPAELQIINLHEHLAWAFDELQALVRVRLARCQIWETESIIMQHRAARKLLRKITRAAQIRYAQSKPHLLPARVRILRHQIDLALYRLQREVPKWVPGSSRKSMRAYAERAQRGEEVPLPPQNPRRRTELEKHETKLAYRARRRAAYAAMDPVKKAEKLARDKERVLRLRESVRALGQKHETYYDPERQRRQREARKARSAQKKANNERQDRGDGADTTSD